MLGFPQWFFVGKVWPQNGNNTTSPLHFATGRFELLQLLSNGRQSDHRGAGWYREGMGVRGRHRRWRAGTANGIWEPHQANLGGGFKYFLFSSPLGEMIQFDSYF